MSIIQGRKVKDWAVFQKIYVLHKGSPIFPGPMYPLKIVISKQD